MVPVSKFYAYFSSYATVILFCYLLCYKIAVAIEVTAAEQ